ncbi:glycosyltransferase family 1 protein [Pseudoalteromonas lipolytica]|uniref:Glycosyltransferase family 1 protein n=1 Tax=Pseudoalteromonas lipolytica TaxID=570156 RepID=A0AAD0WDG1_9GAMM|nr:glycosyltransferase [Pseudoalteromonas donghaensis]AXV66457.1 glycosyltransferase family 1 protein [Pseudoalteromonas donghaensis]
MNDKKVKLNIIASFPPPEGGTTILVKQLYNEIKELDSGYDVYKSDLSLSNASISSFFNFIINFFKCSINSIHVSKGGATFIAPIIIILCKLFFKKSVFRMFGGQFDKYYTNSNIVKKMLVSFVLKNADLIYFETHGLVDFFAKKFPDSNIKHYANSRKAIGNRIVKSKFSNKIVFVGVLKKDKGVGVILEAAKLFPDISFEFVGPSVDDCLLDAMGKLSNCNYLGAVPSEKIYTLIKNADYLALPTFHFGEGYPGVILEAYSIGVPVLSTCWQYIPEIVIEGETGFLCKPNDVNSFHQLLNRVKSVSFSEYSEMSECCYSLFNENYISTQLTKQFIDQVGDLQRAN